MTIRTGPPRTRRTTLKDIARKTELSVPTVSRILNSQEKVCSEKTRKRVLEVARKANYIPNLGYKIMAEMETRIVAIVFSQKRVTYEEHFRTLALSLTSSFEKSGDAAYTVIMSPEASANMDRIRSLKGRGCQSFIFLGSPVGQDEIAQYMQELGDPYIGVNYPALDRNMTLDEGGALLQYVNYFRGIGISNFKIVMPNELFSRYVLARIGNRETDDYVSRFISIPEDDFLPGNCFSERFSVGYSVAEKEFRRNPDIQGLIFISDYHALGAARFFHEHGVNVGRDVLLCGMFNSPAARFSNLPIISSDFDMDRVAAIMLENLRKNGSIECKVSASIIKERWAEKENPYQTRRTN